MGGSLFGLLSVHLFRYPMTVYYCLRHILWSHPDSFHIYLSSSSIY